MAKQKKKKDDSALAVFAGLILAVMYVIPVCMFFVNTWLLTTIYYAALSAAIAIAVDFVLCKFIVDACSESTVATLLYTVLMVLLIFAYQEHPNLLGAVFAFIHTFLVILIMRTIDKLI